MGRRRNKQRRKARKRRTESEEPLRQHQPRHRGHSFFGKVRSGDAAELVLTFSGIPVPVTDPTDPTDLDTQTELAKRNKGEA